MATLVTGCLFSENPSDSLTVPHLDDPHPATTKMVGQHREFYDCTSQRELWRTRSHVRVTIITNFFFIYHSLGQKCPDSVHEKIARISCSAPHKMHTVLFSQSNSIQYTNYTRTSWREVRRYYIIAIALNPGFLFFFCPLSRQV